MSWLDTIRGIEALEDGDFDAGLVAGLDRIAFPADGAVALCEAIGRPAV